MMKTTSLLTFLAFLFATLAVNAIHSDFAKLRRDSNGEKKTTTRKLEGEKTYYAKFIPDTDDIVHTGGEMELYDTYDGTGPEGLSNVVGKYYALIVQYEPDPAASDINDNKLTFVLDDEDSSTLICGGIFYLAKADQASKFPVFGSTGAFADIELATISTDFQVVIFKF